MVQIYLKFDQGVPQFACSSCSSCSSVYGKSLCSIKDRGCCWYFPKFGLHEIHKMTKSEEGLKTLDRIRAIPDARVYKFYIHAKGYFDEVGHKRFLESSRVHQYDVEDKTIFFRGCPFINPSSGCTLPAKYRTCVCNFYICNEIYSEACRKDGFEAYIRERSSYVKWVEWENRSLEYILDEKGINFLSGVQDVVEILESIPLEAYEFPVLEPIEIDDDDNISA